MKTIAGWVRVALVLVIGLASQGCAINLPQAGMPLQAANTDPTASGLAAPAPLAGPVTGSLPQDASATSLLGTATGAPSQASAVPLAASTTGATGDQTSGTSAELDAWQGGRLDPRQFFALIAPAVLESSRRTGVPAAVTLAQAALETGYGKSTVGRAKNLFGVRGTGPAGSVQGNDSGELANFKAYNAWSESITDHDRLVSTGARYRGAMAVRNDPDQFAREIQRAGYATNGTYADQLIRIMRQYNLYAYQPNA